MIMTERTENHNTYAGEIEIDDFNTFSPNKKRINNQADTLKKNQEEKYKHMTLEELREIKLVSNTNGRPSSTLTDEKWQKEFNLRKMFITPYPKSIKKLGGKGSREPGTWNNETQDTYHGRTNWQLCVSNINDILDNIRSGQVDYCYFIYNIMELAKFHYNTLKTRYRDGYWEVWLDGGNK